MPKYFRDLVTNPFYFSKNIKKTKKSSFGIMYKFHNSCFVTFVNVVILGFLYFIYFVYFYALYILYNFYILYILYILFLVPFRH